MAKATAHWTGSKTTFEIQSGSGHTATLDEAEIVGNDKGMRPTEALLGTLGSCTGLNAVLLLQKFRQPLKSLDVEVEGEQEAEWPKGFKRITLTFAITWTGEPDNELVDKALDYSVNRYCPIHATLAHGVTMEIKRRESRNS